MDLQPRRSLSAVDAARARAINRSLVLGRIKSDGPISRAALVRGTRLAKATVSVIVDELVGSGLVVEAGVGAASTRGGRPPVLLRYDGRSELLVGVHVGVQRTTVAVASGSGEELVRRTAATVRDPDAAVAALADLAREALDALRAAPGEVVAVAVCLPGPTDPDRGVCLVAPNLGWRDVEIGPRLAAALGVAAPVRVQNTTQAVALAENLEGAGAGVPDMLLVYVGTGVGAAVVHRGALLGGARGIAGELGHCTVPGATRPCTCGRTGCLETVASASGLRAAVLEAVADGAPRPPGLGRAADAAEIVRLAAAGDAVCLGAVQAAGRELGRAVAWAVNLLNPTRVVVAGGLSDAGDVLLDPVREAVREGALPESLEGLDVRAGALGQEAKVRGAILTALLTWQGAAADRLGG